MKRRFLALLILCSSFAAFGQISYEKDYASALKKARKQKTPLFIFLIPSGNIPEAQYTSSMQQPEVATVYNKNFTNLKLTYVSAAGREIASKYKITRFPYFLFLDTNENLIFRGFSNNLYSGFYLDLAKDVLQRLEKKTTISDYDKQYANGQLNKGFLKEYISLRRNTGITSNAALIEEYVKFLTVQELDNPDEILFILRAGPLVYGKAYGLARNNKKIANEAFMALPLQERIDMNTVMLENTLNEAIAKRNYQMALQVSNFARSTHTNQREGERQAAWKMLVFWKAVGDTSSYFNQAIRYNDTYFMTVGMDSVKKAKADNLKNMELIKNFRKTTPNLANAIPAGRITDPSRITVTSRIVTVMGNGNPVANSLNSAAWDFYTLGTRNSNYLSKALLWSKRSIEMDPLPAYYDTLAHIFYRMGLYDEALLNQNKSIELSDTKPEYKGGIANLKLELNKMKERTL